MTIIPPAEQQRADYIEGLRKLATLLEHYPDLPLPHAGRPGKSHGHSTIGFPTHGELLDLLGRPHDAVVYDYFGLRLVWHLAGLTITADGPKCPEEVTGIRIVNGREVPVTEPVIPEHLRPATEAEKAEAHA